MKRQLEKHHIDNVFLLLLFAVFAGCILMVLLLGASSYEKIVTRDRKAFDARTGVQYVATKIRHADEAGYIETGSFEKCGDTEADGIPTLYLITREGEETYFTKIYYYEGYIRELFCPETISLQPEAGQEVMPASFFQVEQDGPLMRIVIGGENGEQRSINLMIRSSGKEQADGTEE